MIGGPRQWTAADVPPGPYLHGTRLVYEPGDFLRTDVLNNQPGEEDDRQVCFATTDLETAFDWALRRGLRHGGDMLYVYEVDMHDAQVDVNLHRPGEVEDITSVMSTRGTVVRLVDQLPTAEHPDFHTFF